MAFPQPLARCSWVQMSLQGGCVGASWRVWGHQAHTRPTQTVGRAHLCVITKYTSVPRGAPHLKPHQEDPSAAPLWGCSQGWARTARHRGDTRADSPCWGSCGFHLSKMFPWTGSLSPSCCRGLPPCPGTDHRATCCRGSSVFLLGSQMLAARQAKGELGCACYLEAPPDECSDGRRFVSLI